GSIRRGHFFTSLQQGNIDVAYFGSSRLAKRECAAALAALAEGRSPARLNFYDGAQPPSPDVATDQVVLASLHLRSPAFGIDPAGVTTRPRLGPKAKIPNHDGTRLRFARDSPL